MTLRLLALAAPFGSGHLQAARAVVEAFEEHFPGSEGEAINLSSRLVNSVSAGYLTMIEKAPDAYRNLYRSPVGAGLRRLVRTALGGPVQSQLARVRPDLVVATHPFPALVLGDLRRRGLLRAPVGVVTTDFVPHALWAGTGVDRYFVPSEPAAAHLGRLGVEPGRICASGIPVPLVCDEASSGLTWASAVRRVLVMGGGLGLGPVTQAVAALITQPLADLEVTVVCGRNEELRRKLQDRFGADPRLTVLGFSPIVPVLMKRAQLVITKPGGLTCSEAMASGLPMLLLHPLPGHEEENAEYLCRVGAARVVGAEQVGQAATELLFADRAKLERMQAASRQAGRPQAALTIAVEMAGLAARPASAIA